MCARFPIARMSVSVGVREMLEGKQTKARSQAPVAPKTPIRPILHNDIE
jgi:hypothetical protein